MSRKQSSSQWKAFSKAINLIFKSAAILSTVKTKCWCRAKVTSFLLGCGVSSVFANFRRPKSIGATLYQGDNWIKLNNIWYTTIYVWYINRNHSVSRRHLRRLREIVVRVMDGTQVKANMVKKLELFAGRRHNEELGPGRWTSFAPKLIKCLLINVYFAGVSSAELSAPRQDRPLVRWRASLLHMGRHCCSLCEKVKQIRTKK